MKRYLFLANYDGDPTKGYDFDVVAPFDKTELVQPDVGDLYPDSPANMVLISVECQEHTKIADYTPEIEDLMWATQKAMLLAPIESSMDQALIQLKSTYTFVGEINYV
jgi:hypothetical protein